MINWILTKIIYPLVKWVKIAEIDRNLRNVKVLAADFEAKRDAAPEVFTTIRSFVEDQAGYWQWAKAVYNADQFRFLIFQLRENIIREMSMCKDKEQLPGHIGRLECLNIVANYLKTGIEEYEASLRRIAEDTKGN